MNTERDLRIASKSNAVLVARWWRTFCGLSHTACYTVFDGAFKPLILLDFFRARIFFNPLLYRLSYRARGGIVTGVSLGFPGRFAAALEHHVFGSKIFARVRHQLPVGGVVHALHTHQPRNQRMVMGVNVFDQMQLGLGGAYNQNLLRTCERLRHAVVIVFVFWRPAIT